LISFASLIGLGAAGCVRHIHPYKPKVRDYKLDRYASVGDGHASGSLWSDSSDTLFTHRRSHRIGDLITVMIREQSNATRNAGTELSRSTERKLGIDAFAGAMKALAAAHPSIDPSKLISLASKNEFSGKGETKRSGTLDAMLTARIKRVLPNGDLYVEGHKVVLINDEESHLYLSGVVRPSDLEADNTVLSSVIADMQLEYTGRGDIANQQRQGWLSKILDFISPF
jgi:flagellar L-ring protein precursor FlgH